MVSEGGVEKGGGGDGLVGGEGGERLAVEVAEDEEGSLHGGGRSGEEAEIKRGREERELVGN